MHSFKIGDIIVATEDFYDITNTHNLCKVKEISSKSNTIKVVAYSPLKNTYVDKNLYKISDWDFEQFQKGFYVDAFYFKKYRKKSNKHPKWF